MNPVYLFLIIAALTGLDSRPALASHLEGLRGAGEGLAASTFWLSLGAAIAFLVLGSLTVLGLRHLHRPSSGSPNEISEFARRTGRTGHRRGSQSGREEPW